MAVVDVVIVVVIGKVEVERKEIRNDGKTVKKESSSIGSIRRGARCVTH